MDGRIRIVARNRVCREGAIVGTCACEGKRTGSCLEHSRTRRRQSLEGTVTDATTREVLTRRSHSGTHFFAHIEQEVDVTVLAEI